MRLSPKLKEWLLPFLGASAVVVPGLFFGYGVYLVHRDGRRNADGSRGDGMLLMAAAVFFWLVLSLLLAQQRRHYREMVAADGEFYAFDDQRIHARFDDDDALWLRAIDLAHLLNKSRDDLRRMLIGFGDTEHQRHGKDDWLSESGVMRLLSRRTGRRIALLERYLVGEVFAVHAKRRNAGKLHYQQRPFVYNSTLVRW